MVTILSFLQVVISVVLIFLVLMHSGKDAGLSGAFGVGTGAGPLGGGSLVERNLNRWTIAFAIAFVVNTIVLIKISLPSRPPAPAPRCRDRQVGSRPVSGPAQRPGDPPAEASQAD